MMARDLAARFSDQQIMAALTRVMRECDWITLKAINERIPGAGTDDGRPDVEIAWAMCPKTEEVSVVWTDEMATAFGVARPLLNDGDAIAARMAFKAAYAAEVILSRSKALPVKWQVSLGYDKNDRVRAVSEAVAKHRITTDAAMALVGDMRDELLLVMGSQEAKRLGTSLPSEEVTSVRQILREVAASKGMPQLIRTREMTDEERMAHVKRTREWAANIKRLAAEKRELPPPSRRREVNYPD